MRGKRARGRLVFFSLKSFSSAASAREQADTRQCQQTDGCGFRNGGDDLNAIDLGTQSIPSDAGGPFFRSEDKAVGAYASEDEVISFTRGRQRSGRKGNFSGRAGEIGAIANEPVR